MPGAALSIQCPALPTDRLDRLDRSDRLASVCSSGKNLDKKALIDGFMACKCEEKLRFSVGEAVLAKVGPRLGGPDGYAPGKILKLWDNGNAYRIELQNAEKTNVWGPIDEDIFVKAAPAAVS